MDQDDAIRARKPLYVDEIAQREFKLVHAIDERHVDRPPAKFMDDVMIGKKVVAGLCENKLVGARGFVEDRLRVHPQCPRVRTCEPQRSPPENADFDVGSWPQVRMHARQHLEVILAVQLDIGEQDVGGGKARDAHCLIAQLHCPLGVPQRPVGQGEVVEVARFTR